MDYREEIMDGQHRANTVVRDIKIHLDNMYSNIAREAFKDELKVQLEKLLNLPTK